MFHLISTKLFILPNWQSSMTKHQRKDSSDRGFAASNSPHSFPASSLPLPAHPRALSSWKMQGNICEHPCPSWGLPRAQSHGLAWVGRDLQDYLIPTPCSWAECCCPRAVPTQVSRAVPTPVPVLGAVQGQKFLPRAENKTSLSPKANKPQGEPGMRESNH